MGSDNTKYLLVWDRLGDYHRARVKALTELVGEKYVFTADLGAVDKLYRWESNTGENLHYQLSEKPVGRSDLINRFRKYRNILKDQGIDVVAIAGYGRLEYLLMMFFARLAGIKVIVFAESWYPGNWLFDKLKGLLLSILANGFFVSGIRAEKHFQNRLGIPLQKIKKGYSVVDNDHFKRVSVHQLKSSSVQQNIQLNRSTNEPINHLTHQPYLLCVARYSVEKNLPFLIDAYRKSNKYQKWKLVLIGDGPLKEELVSVINNDHDWIKLVGWKSYIELPAWYQEAEALVLPSTFEPWGLVVNEAMAAGIPVLASKACGCVEDLLRAHPRLPARQAEYIFDPRDSESLIKALDGFNIAGDKGYPPVSLDELYSCNAWANNLVKLSLMKPF